jgi:hypothetical protein
MKTSQFATGLFIIIVLVLIVLYFRYYDRSKINFIASGLFMITCFVLFYKLNTTITKENIRISFGIGLITKTIATRDIESVQVVRNSPLAGWGIRYARDYTLYNIHGLSAVELSLRGQSKKIRIGYEQPEEVCKYLSQFISGKTPSNP